MQNYSNTKNNDHVFQNSTKISKYVFDNKIQPLNVYFSIVNVLSVLNVYSPLQSTPSFPIGLVKTESDVIVGSVETGLVR